MTCYETEKIYIEWKRPKTYYKTVDYYYIYYKAENESVYQNVQIQANADDDQRFFLEEDNVDVKRNYCMKICAGTKSTRSSSVYKGEFSEELCVNCSEVEPAGTPAPSLAPSPAAELSAGIIGGALLLWAL